MKFVKVEERSAYYEADKHTLLALQKMATEPFPLSEHLVGVHAASSSSIVEAKLRVREHARNISRSTVSNATAAAPAA